jgi:ribonuclease BN (tRNA processing enzyme)
MGFPSCPLLLNPEWSVDIAMAKRPDVEDLEEAIRGWMIPPWWPVTLDMMPARKQFTMLEPYSTETPLLIGGLEIRWCPQEHPGGSTAFRIDEPSTGSSVVISTDVEWSASSPELQKALQDLCRDATWLIFDGKCTPEEYERFRGYGHSTWMEGIELARSCGVENLIITHHGTDMTDEVCDAREAAIQAVWDKTQLARQGMQWTL